MCCRLNRLGLLRALCLIQRFVHATVAAEEGGGVSDGEPMAAVPVLPQVIIQHWHVRLHLLGDSQRWHHCPVVYAASRLFANLIG